MGQLVIAQNEDSLVKVLKGIEINSITSLEEHKEFLINVNNADQGIRETVFSTEEEFGFGSIQYDSAFYKWVAIDRYLFEIVVDYLKRYSYPEKVMGVTPCSTPILIFHHVQGKQEDLILKKNFFPMFYEAYLNETITSSEIWFYLFRLYGQITAEKYLNSEIGEEQQIEELIEHLELKRK